MLALERRDFSLLILSRNLWSGRGKMLDSGTSSHSTALLMDTSAKKGFSSSTKLGRVGQKKKKSIALTTNGSLHKQYASFTISFFPSSLPIFNKELLKVLIEFEMESLELSPCSSFVTDDSKYPFSDRDILS